MNSAKIAFVAINVFRE